jgi:hypothetical protein
MPVWDDLLTEEERKVLEVFRQPKTLGTRPAILVIDVNYAKYGMVMSLNETTAYLQRQAQPTPTVRRAP